MLAKAKKATPFKRPENAKFLPGSHFDTFFFCPTDDTDSRSGSQPELAARGAWGSIFKVRFPWWNRIGAISIAVLGDADHAAFDNLTFADSDTLLTTEDRGDTLHDQLDKLDGFPRQPWFSKPGDRFDRTPTRWFVTQQHGLNQVFEIVPRH